jgi:hypothetical protein
MTVVQMKFWRQRIWTAGEVWDLQEIPRTIELAIFNVFSTHFLAMRRQIRSLKTKLMTT